MYDQGFPRSKDGRKRRRRLQQASGSPATCPLFPGSSPSRSHLVAECQSIVATALWQKRRAQEGETTRRSATNARGGAGVGAQKKEKEGSSGTGSKADVDRTFYRLPLSSQLELSGNERTFSFFSSLPPSSCSLMFFVSHDSNIPFMPGSN